MYLVPAKCQVASAELAGTTPPGWVRDLRLEEPRILSRYAESPLIRTYI